MNLDPSPLHELGPPSVSSFVVMFFREVRAVPRAYVVAVNAVQVRRVVPSLENLAVDHNTAAIPTTQSAVMSGNHIPYNHSSY